VFRSKRNEKKTSCFEDGWHKDHRRKMMNISRILQNSWNLTLRYRALWIFGVILAITTVSFGSAIWLSGDENLPDQTLVNWEISAQDQAWIKENFGFDLPLSYTLKVEDLNLNLDDPSLSRAKISRLLNITITIMAFLLVLLVVTLVLRYIAEAALITMVNDQQTNNDEYSARKGWSLGFSITAFKLFLIDLVVYTMLLMLTPMIFLPALLPVVIAINGSPAAITISLLLMSSLTLFSLAALIIMWIAGMVTCRFDLAGDPRAGSGLPDPGSTDRNYVGGCRSGG
jgi:hypothetical protein